MVTRPMVSDLGRWQDHQIMAYMEEFRQPPYKHHYNYALRHYPIFAKWKCAPYTPFGYLWLTPHMGGGGFWVSQTETGQIEYHLTGSTATGKWSASDGRQGTISFRLITGGELESGHWSDDKGHSGHFKGEPVYGSFEYGMNDDAYEFQKFKVCGIAAEVFTVGKLGVAGGGLGVYVKDPYTKLTAPFLALIKGLSAGVGAPLPQTVGFTPYSLKHPTTLADFDNVYVKLSSKGVQVGVGYMSVILTIKLPLETSEIDFSGWQLAVEAKVVERLSGTLSNTPWRDADNAPAAIKSWELK